MKFFKSAVPRAQIEHELKVAGDLNPKYILRPVKIERSAKQSVLVLEECPYPPLSQSLGAPQETETFLRIAIGITAALAEVHNHGLVHKDIKPENIFADKTGAAKIGGFGLASGLSSERLPPGPAEEIAGSLAYMAPEQTGRMNRSIDSRSDLYSLGVTFYQMLTGRLPFTASDPLEWVHCHIALQPEPPGEYLETIPEPLSNIVMKLLAKTAEERYQTAEGLKADLERCLEDWRTLGDITLFPLGVHDVPDYLLIPEKLYGREREVETLLAAFDRVASGGKSEFVLVSGYAGVGKSAVVNEMHKALVPSRGLFASGKFDQYQRGIPYATLAQAFQMLIRPLLGKSDDALSDWRQAFEEALEPNGQLIVDLIPELKFVIGEQSPVQELEPKQAKTRFQLVFSQFVRVFARPEHPLALFIDDLQWLDSATLDLIERITTQEDIRHLLLIGAYRDNEVGPDHPLTHKLEAIRDVGVQVTEIRLVPLSLTDLTQMIADSLRCGPSHANPLAKLVHSKTAGNPFFSIQFLSALDQEGLLAFDHDEGRWAWNLDRIKSKGYTDNVADLMAAKLIRLPDRARKAVLQLACLGTSAQSEILSLVFEVPEKEVYAVLREAVGQGFIQKYGDSYRFVHDRVQEAAYALIPKASRAETHLRIGRLLLAHTSEEELEEAIFRIVSQVNRAVTLISSPDECEKLARLNLLAGKRAKGSTAYTEALTYLSKGNSLLGDERWERQHQLAFALEINQAECEFLTGELEIAEQHLAELFPRAESTVERASVASLFIDLYITLGQMDRAVTVGLDYLRHLGIDWSVHPTAKEARKEYEQIWLTLGDRAVEDLIDLPVMTDPALLATMDVLIKLRPPALFTDANLVSMVICKAVNLSLGHGNTDGSSFAYASFGVVAGPHFGNYEAAFRFGKLGYDLVEQRGMKRFQARTLTNFGMFVMPWAKHIREGRDLLLRAFGVASRSGDIIYGAYACNNLVSNYLMAGDPLDETEREASSGLDYVRKARFGLVADIITSQIGLIRSLRGVTQKFGSFDEEQFNEREFEAHFSDKPGLAVAECFHWIRRLQARFFAGDYEAAIAVSEKAEALIWTTKPFIEIAEYSFYTALSHMARCDSVSKSRRRRHLKVAVEQLNQLETWAKICPENFENRAALVAAEVARIEGRPLDAMNLYEKAIHSARASDFVHNEALAHELAGRFYLGRGLETTGLAHLHRASIGYALWGADGKRKQLDALYPELSELQSRLASSEGAAVPPQTQLDMMTVTRASQAVSEEIELPRLIETLMTSALENAGADRGLLILPSDEEFEVEVEARASGVGVEVKLMRTSIKRVDCAETVINFVARTRRNVILDDVSRPGEFLEDAYLQRGLVRSVFCLPLLRQSKLTGVLYLENTQVTGAFTPERIAVLDVLAVQAAISLENAHLYSDLRESEEKFRTLVQKISAAVVVHDADTKILVSNSVAQKLLGLSEEQMQGKTAIDPAWHFLREDGSEMPLEEYPVNQVLASRCALQNLVVGIHRPGRKEDVWALVSATPLLGEEGDIEQVIVSFTDITERKAADQRLAASEQLFRTLVENSPDYIARYDLDLRRIYVNPALQKQFPGPAKDLLGKTTEETFSPLTDPDRYMANIRQVINTAAERSDELSYKDLEGELRWTSMRFAPEFDAVGKLASVLVISNDITDKKRAEHQLQAYLDILKSLDRINRVLQEEGGFKQVLTRVLDEVLDIFDCDRVYLLYPCDPNSATWTAPMERCRPEYPGVLELGLEMPMNEMVAWEMRLVLDSDHPVCVGPGTDYPVADFLQEQFSIRSFMAMALYPKVDVPWQFGVHQCSYDRVWSDQEVRLFEEVGRRLSDGLNSLLVTRNLRESEERYHQFFENAPLPIREEDYSAVKGYLETLGPEFADDMEGYLTSHPEVLRECAQLVRVLDINHTALVFHEAESKETLQRSLQQIFVPDSLAAFRSVVVALMRGDTSFRLEAAVQTVTGRRQNTLAHFSVTPGYEQNLGKILVSLVDITERKRTEDQLRLAASVFAHSQEGILISDADNRIIDINPAFTRLTGYTRDDVIGENPRILSSRRHSQEFYAEMWRSIAAEGEWQGEIWNRRKSGDEYAELLSIVAIKDDAGRLQHYVGAFTDITVIKQHEEDLDRIAHYDVLTSVPNRRLLRDRLEQAIARARRLGNNLAVCYLDLDGFKPINDQFGHEGGDRMLVEIARRLQSMLRADDTVARLGGDEFVLLWHDVGEETDCVQALERVLAKVSEPMMLGGEPVSVSASIGVTLYPDDNVDADNLLRHADHAMYSAKQLGKNRFQMFDARLERQIALRVEFLAKVERGLEESQFELYYQPKADCITGALHGVEALLRWNDPILGLVGPKEFLSLIENDSLAFRMGRWVMEQAVRQARFWNDRGIALPISINIFPRHLKYQTFVDDLRNAIESYWPTMPRGRLLMEIVESSDLEDLEPIEQVIKECLKMGVGFSLDDFGTGYSSLVYLRRLSIEELKIDQSFVRDMLEDPSDHAIVVGVIRLGQAFGLRVVAEGVESVEQARHLVGLGCSVVQGYGLGRPMPVFAFEKWYADFVVYGTDICQ